MKTLLMTASILAATGSAAFAQDMTAKFRTAADPLEIHASSFIGKRVYAAEAAIDADAYNGTQPDWQDIGEINDVILSRDGAVEAVLVDIGGFLGMGERQVAVEIGSIRFVADDATAEDLSDFFLVMQAPRDVLETAPAYSWAAPDVPSDEAASNEAASQMPLTAREGYAVADPTQLTAEMLTGAEVYDAQDEWIGEVSQLNLDPDGQIAEAVIDVGGFLGIGEKPVAMPIDTVDILRANEGDDLRVYVSMTKEEMDALPTYTE